METLVIQVESNAKIKKLIEFLKTLDYVITIERQSNLEKARVVFERIHQKSDDAGLSNISMEEIDEILKEIRHEHPLGH